MPLAAKLSPELENLVLLVDGPFVASHIWIDDIDPALTALSWLPLASWADSFVELFSDASPLLWLS